MESRVFDTLREMTATLLDADEVIKEAGNNANFRIDQKRQREDQCKEKEITKYNQMLVSLYEDYKDGIVDKSDFAIIKESFEVKGLKRKRQSTGYRKKQKTLLPELKEIPSGWKNTGNGKQCLLLPVMW